MPKTGSETIRREAKHGGLLHRGRVIGEEPAMPRADIAVRRVANVDSTVVETQSRALVPKESVERDFPARACLSRACHRCVNQHRVLLHRGPVCSAPVNM